MTQTPPTPPQGPPMELPAGLEPIYANLVRITHSPAELILDFATLLPGIPSARISARLMMSPVSAKLFHAALGENLARYEATYGQIPLPGSGNLAQELFRPPHPPEPPKEG